VPPANTTIAAENNGDSSDNTQEQPYISSSLWQDAYANSRSVISQVCDEMLPSVGRRDDKDWYAVNKKLVSTILAKQHLLWCKYEKCKRLSQRTARAKQKTKYALNKWTLQKNLVRKECRRLRREYWTELAGEIQSSYDRNDIGLYFAQLKKKLGTVVRSPQSSGLVQTAQKLANGDGTFAVSSKDRLKRWLTHFQGILNQQGVVGENLERYLPVQREVDLGLDVPFSEAELECAILQLARGKATGSDGIPIELERYCLGDKLRSVILSAFNGALSSGEVLHDFKDVEISVLFKKGDKTDCNNYRGISIINHEGKLLERMIQNRLLPFVQDTGCIPESQCGFLPGRSTVDAVLVSRLVSTFALERRDSPLYKCFIDLTKAYDKVDRDTLWSILSRLGVPPKLLRVIVNLHVGAMATVKMDGEISEEFELKRGLKQGSVFAPLLFNVFFGAIINAFRKECELSEIETGVSLGLNFDGNWRNNFVMNHLIKQRETNNRSRYFGGEQTRNSAFELRLLEILFADDCELFAVSEEALQKMINIFVEVASTFAQEVSVKKTKVMVVEKGGEKKIPRITVNGTVLEVVDDFVYLGSKESNTGDMSAEVNVRKQRMYAAFNQWSGRILMNKSLSLHLRLSFFNLIVVSNGLYGCATWNLCAKQVRELDSVQFQLLKLLFGIHFSEHVSYEEILLFASQAGYPILPLECKIAKLQLRYIGHVERMESYRLQKQLLYSSLILEETKNKRGAPARNYRQAISDALIKFGYSIENWRNAVVDRGSWRKHLNTLGQDYFMQNWLNTREEKRLKRHETGVDEVDSADDLLTVYEEEEEEEEEEANEQQQTGGRRVVATFEEPTTSYDPLIAERSEEDVILPNLPTMGRRRYIIKARKRREAAAFRDSMDTPLIGEAEGGETLESSGEPIFLIGVLNQVLVADEAHTA
jgi:hypothetical protein